MESAEVVHLELEVLVLQVRLGCFRVWTATGKLEVVQELKLKKMLCLWLGLMSRGDQQRMVPGELLEPKAFLLEWVLPVLQAQGVLTFLGLMVQVAYLGGLEQPERMAKRMKCMLQEAKAVPVQVVLVLMAAFLVWERQELVLVGRAFAVLLALVGARSEEQVQLDSKGELECLALMGKFLVWSKLVVAVLGAGQAAKVGAHQELQEGVVWVHLEDHEPKVALQVLWVLLANQADLANQEQPVAQGMALPADRQFLQVVEEGWELETPVLQAAMARQAS